MPNRYMCTVLSEMRTCFETRNFAYLPGLIEEAQTLANRMEASLGDKRDVEEWRDERSDLRQEIGELRKEARKLRNEIADGDE